MPAVPVVHTAMASAGNGCVGLWHTLNLHPLFHDVDWNPQYTTAQQYMPSFRCARKSSTVHDRYLKLSAIMPPAKWDRALYLSASNSCLDAWTPG